MLETKNLTKIYTPKKGLPVLALDKVSLRFAETGMVFVLGKSGSGKSTFLNLISGLDSMTEGEVIVKGKSSKEFSAGDFDSYRNTFLGFIFQEFNILNEFSIGKNIALALELQGKKASEKTVEDILEQVDLKGYANRRPNELSGGQKQRVAIARALIKNPEIIVADEPTGSLDSNTGKQIFETLQKLSKTKLVIIVSHDREHAEFYGDRVIEFADGRVISDIQKKKIETDGQSKSKDFRRFADTDSDELFEYVTPENQDIKQYNPKDFKLFSARLPTKHALKMATSSLKAKPLRLIFTLVLLITAFTMFGVADSWAAFNKYKAMYQAMQYRGIDYMSFGKEIGDEGNGTSLLLTEHDADTIKNKFPNSKFDALRTPNTNITEDYHFQPLVYSNNIYQYQKDPKVMASYYSQRQYRAYLGDNSYWGPTQLFLSGIIEVDPNGVSEQAYRGFNITGNFPASENEVMVSYYVYEAYQKYGYIDAAAMLLDGAEIEDIDNYKITISSISDFLGKELLLDAMQTDTLKTVKVVGVIDTSFPKTYDKYKEYMPPARDYVEADSDWYNIEQTTYFVGNSYHGALFVKAGAYQDFEIAQEEEKHLKLSEMAIWSGYGRATAKLNVTLTPNPSYDWFYWINNGTEVLYTATAADIGSNGLVTAFADPSKTTLNENEALLSIRLAADAFSKIKGVREVTNWVNNFGQDMEDDDRLRALPQAFIDKFFEGKTSIPATSSLFCAPIDDFEGYHTAPITDIVGIALDTEFSIEPYSLHDNPKNFNTNGAIISDGLHSTISDVVDLHSGHNIIAMLTKLPDKSKVAMEMILYSYQNIYTNGHPLSGCTLNTYIPDGDTLKETTLILDPRGSYMLRNGVSYMLHDLGGYMEFMTKSKGLLNIGIILALFASMLFMNFIFASISYKYKEIGILRALGAKPMDIFKIFVLESLIIAIFCCILSVATTGIAAYFINLKIISSGYYIVSILNFGIRQVALILLVGVLTTVISTFLPLFKASRQKPIETIRKGS